MVYFFYGADSYRIRQKVNKVIESYQAKHKSGLNFGRFDFAEEDFSKVKNFLESYSMFEEKKLAVLENLFGAGAETLEKFTDFLEKSDIVKTADNFLVIAQELEVSAERRAKEKYILRGGKESFKKLTAKNIEAEEFDFLGGVKLENWVNKEVAGQGGKISAEAVKKITVYVGADLWQMQNELGKLISFKGGKTITGADIDSLVKAKIENDIFKTIDALAARNKTAALKFLHRHLAEGESEIYLLGMLVYQFRNLLLVKDQIERGTPVYGLEKKLKLNPFVLRKSFEQSKNFSLGVLKKIYERLLEIDLDIKSGRVEAKAALDLVISEIAG
jgi:DNA polymerase-3 subunit delta